MFTGTTDFFRILPNAHGRPSIRGSAFFGSVRRAELHLLAVAFLKDAGDPERGPEKDGGGGGLGGGIGVGWGGAALLAVVGCFCGREILTLRVLAQHLFGGKTLQTWFTKGSDCLFPSC